METRKGREGGTLCRGVSRAFVVCTVRSKVKGEQSTGQAVSVVQVLVLAKDKRCVMGREV